MNSRSRTLLALALGLSAASTAPAAVTVQSQHAQVSVRAESGCESTGASPQYQIAESTAVGPLDLIRNADDVSGCGSALAVGSVSVDIAEDSIRGAGTFFGTLNAVGVMHTSFEYGVALTVDQPTQYRIELRLSVAASGDEAQLFGIVPQFSDGDVILVEPGVLAWEGTLEPGQSYEFKVCGVASRASLGLPDGSYRANDGSNSGSMEFSMEFQSTGVVATETVSMAQMKSQY